MENKIQYERRFTIIEEKLDSHCVQQEKDFAEVKADTKDVKSDIKELSQKIEKFIESVDQKQELFTKEADQRYADKETEKIVKGVGWLIFAAFVSALIYLIGWGE